MKNSEYFQKVSAEIESLCKNVIEKYQSRFGAAFLDRHIFNRQVNNLSNWDFSNPEMMDALRPDRFNLS